jgi:hypothetical protein
VSILGWTIAAAGLGRGLTSDELTQVETEIRNQLAAALITDPLSMSSQDAQAVLTAAIETVLVRTRA